MLFHTTPMIHIGEDVKNTLDEILVNIQFLLFL